MELYNKLSREEAIRRLNQEPFTRRTFSFYRYFRIPEPQEFRDALFIAWSELNCFGRIYIACEGINAQMSIPEHHLNTFLSGLNKFKGMEKMPVKFAVEDDGKSFYKLTIKVRPKIVADGLDENEYDVTNVGTHLSAFEFHQLAGNSDSVVIDMRNHYESEIGRFVNAYCPDVDTFREAIIDVAGKLDNKDNRKILLYCTGGIRCEKASAYLKHRGFENVYQLHGGIIEYARFIKRKKLPSKFIGKNFVFDNRLGEIIDGQVISYCHQCGRHCDTHTNCANDDCHLLFIQCDECKERYNGCCSKDCKKIIALPKEDQKKYRQLRHQKYAESKIFKSRLRKDISEKIRTEHYSGVMQMEMEELRRI